MSKKKTRISRKRVVVTAKDARVRQALGNGFTRWVFNTTIGPRTFFAFTFNAGSRSIISNGFWVSANQSLDAHETSSYSQTPNRGITVVFNPTLVTRQAQFFFITKD
ncbi:hypothetical protein [Ammoniphilus sp. CFH 90114]|uniref:hypothetical protein n=1 Tax=Ammoniphilus sp. CFH 90114 TaxID=2493665 RepID=UPI00100F1488|nr:hypothetical protein [Ammoniphilus sp. CFH 90114]RXT05183.1 hypothetical protein EIZ39_17490 [Ammoniphilus sp. CFH 90114]